MRSPLDAFPRMADLITPGEHGAARLDIITVGEEQARIHNMRCAFQPGGSVATIEPGRYARLTRNGNGGVTMTDTRFERRTTWPAYREAHGDTLILGLGLGMLPIALEGKDDVDSVTIVEIDPDVIALVKPVIDKHAPNTIVIEGDAFLPERTGLPTTREGGGFDTIFADIWPTICADDYVEHVALRRAWRRWRRPGSKHVTWVEDTVEQKWRAMDGSLHRRVQPNARTLATDLLRVRRHLASEEDAA